MLTKHLADLKWKFAVISYFFPRLYIFLNTGTHTHIANMFCKVVKIWLFHKGFHWDFRSSQVTEIDRKRCNFNVISSIHFLTFRFRFQNWDWFSYYIVRKSSDFNPVLLMTSLWLYITLKNILLMWKMRKCALLQLSLDKISSRSFWSFDFHSTINSCLKKVEVILF